MVGKSLRSSGFSAAVAATWVANAASAQGPSISFLPTEPALSESSAHGISPDGRFVVGFYDGYYGSACNVDEVYRWDRLTGAQLHLAVPMEGSFASVLNDGRVYTSTASTLAFCIETGSRILRWNPDTGEQLFAPRAGDPLVDDYFARVSRDGSYVMGYTTVGYNNPLMPALYDFGFSPPLRIDLNPGEGTSITRSNGYWGVPGFGAVSNQVAGVRRAYATTSGPDGVLGKTWIVANAEAMTAGREVYDVNPGGDILLGKIGATFHVAGGGADRFLTAPISPVILYDPMPSRISDDGRVAVGYSKTQPGAYSGNSEAVVWRAGQNPTSLRALLQSAGVAVPNWVSAWIDDVSADGSTVVGSYTVQAFNPNEFYPRRAFVAVLPSANDNCQTARAVTYGTIIDSTTGATRAGFNGSCASEGSAPDIWFSFTPIATENITIDTCGSSFDTTLNVYAASSCAALTTSIACNDDASPSCPDNPRASRVNVNVAAGQNYFIRVSGWNGAFGSVRMTITAPNRPSNDTCAQPTSVAQGAGAFWSNTNAVTDARPNCPGAGTPFSDVWFQTVPVETGRMNYSTCGSSINTVMVAYPDSGCANINAAPIACGQSNASCNGNPGTRLTVSCTAGEPQLLRVGGLFGAQGSGTFTATFACDASVLSTYDLNVLNHGARALWKFDDSGSLTAADAVRADPYTCGNYPGQYVGTTRVNSYMGKALHFDGSGPYARFDTVPLLHVNDPASCPAATLEAWVRTVDPAAGVILTSRNDPQQHSLTLVLGYNPIGIPNTAGRVMFVADGPGSFFGAISGVRLDDGNWHHVVGLREVRNPLLGTYNYTLFVDGVYQGFNNLAGGVGSAHSGVNGSYWTVGNGLAWPSGGAAFNGMIDNVALYCGALSASQIAGHSTLGAPPPCDSLDFNGDGLYPDTADIDDFLSVFSGGPCSTGTCHDIDFNNDGLFPDTADIDDFLRVFSGGPC
ncbi:MAG: LamG domain-containing protein [Phycisphaerales bacterium]